MKGREVSNFKYIDALGQYWSPDFIMASDVLGQIWSPEIILEGCSYS